MPIARSGRNRSTATASSRGRGSDWPRLEQEKEGTRRTRRRKEVTEIASRTRPAVLGLMAALRAAGPPPPRQQNKGHLCRLRVLLASPCPPCPIFFVDR